LLRSALSARFPPWRLVSAASVMALSPIAFITTYDYSTLGDFERLILGWWHVGLMAGSGFVGIARVGCMVILVRR
jgi:hypothetical protein